MIRKYRHIIFWVIGSCTLMLLLGFVGRDQQQVLFTDIQVHIDRSEGNFFIDEKTIVGMIHNLGYREGEHELQTIDIRHIERLLETVMRLHAFLEHSITLQECS